MISHSIVICPVCRTPVGCKTEGGNINYCFICQWKNECVRRDLINRLPHSVVASIPCTECSGSQC